MGSIGRGALIVLEGCDKVGKSTHVKLLQKALETAGKKSIVYIFPDRSTFIGQTIDKYLKQEVEIPDEAIHLLFSANRWEAKSKLEESLRNGTNIIVDRYAFSGVAFSAAKGLDFDWCKNCDAGLPSPDTVIFLDIPVKDASGREAYGGERYESAEFQTKVKSVFQLLKSPDWKVVKTNRPKEEAHKEIMEIAIRTIQECEEGKELKYLWN